MSDVIPGLWSPTDEAEMALYEGLLDVTGTAYREAGVSRDSIVGALLNTAQVVLSHETDVEADSGPHPTEVSIPCPQCGVAVESVVSGLGGDYAVIHKEAPEGADIGICHVPRDGNEHLEDLQE